MVPAQAGVIHGATTRQKKDISGPRASGGDTSFRMSTTVDNISPRASGGDPTSSNKAWPESPLSLHKQGFK